MKNWWPQEGDENREMGGGVVKFDDYRQEWLAPDFDWKYSCA